MIKENKERIAEEEMLMEATRKAEEEMLVNKKMTKENKERITEEEISMEATMKAEEEKVMNEKSITEEKERIAEEVMLMEETMKAEKERLAKQERLKEQQRIEDEEKCKEALKKAEEDRLFEKAEKERIEIAKRVAEAERMAELERISKAEQLAEKERLAMLERIETEKKLQEELKIAEANKLMEQQRILEEKRKLELQKIEIAKMLAEVEKAKEERKRAEAEQLAEYERIKKARRIAFKEAIVMKASEIAGKEPSAFFGGRKNEQTKKIQKLLTENIPFKETAPTPSIDVFTLKGAQQDQLSKEVTELFPGVYLASFLTLSESRLSAHMVDTVVEVARELHDLAAEAVVHIKQEGVDTEDNFDKIADKIACTINKGGKVLISCEDSTGLAATLSIAYAVKYQGIRVKNAAKSISKKRPQADLDPTILIKLYAWQWKLRREQLFQQTLQVVANWLPMLSMLGLLCLALKLFQDEIERQHQMEKISPEYEYFDILKWP